MATEPTSTTSSARRHLLRRNGPGAGRQERRRSAADRRDRHGRRPGRSAVRAAVPDGQQPGPSGRVGPRRAGRAVRQPAAGRRRPTCRKVMDDSIDVVRRHREAGTLLNDEGKIAEPVLAELGDAGYWGLLVDKEYGGSGAPFARFAPFLTRMATVDPTVAGLASVHGCIGAVDPVRTFGNDRAEAAVPARAGQRRAAQRVRPHRALRRQRPHGAAHHGRARRRRLRRQRREAVHHQRRARPHDRAGLPDRRASRPC